MSSNSSQVGDNMFTNYLTVLRRWRNVDTAACLVLEGCQWGRIDILTFGAICRTVGGMPAFGHSSQGSLSTTSVTLNETSTDRTPVVSFIITGDGSPIDISVSCRRTRPASSGRGAILYLGGQTYIVSLDRRNNGSTTFTNCPLLLDNKFLTPAVLRTAAHSVTVQINTPETNLFIPPIPDPSYHGTLRIDEINNQSITYSTRDPSGLTVRSAIVCFFIVNDGRPIDLEIGWSSWYRDGRGPLQAEVVICDKTYSANTSPQRGTEAFYNCPLLRTPPNWRPEEELQGNNPAGNANEPSTSAETSAADNQSQGATGGVGSGSSGTNEESPARPPSSSQQHSDVNVNSNNLGDVAGTQGDNSPNQVEKPDNANGDNDPPSTPEQAATGGNENDSSGGSCGPSTEPSNEIDSPQQQSNNNGSTSDPASTAPDQRPGTPFALIIGINNYRNVNQFFRPLSGAVADADDVSEFCISTLRMPRERIRNLRDEQATRSNIIDAITALGEDPSIQANDPILIYYAGHGSHTGAPEGWPARGDVQMILPQNFDPRSTTSSPAESQGILDLQLAQLLNEVAKKKSNNITVILDSCHSASSTRVGRTADTRGINLPQDYANAQVLVDEVVPRVRASNIAKGFERKGLASHVLLAACQEGEEAHESGGRGVFTTELMRLLRDRGVGQLSYTDAIQRLPRLRNPNNRPQNPQCEGIHQYRILFDGRVPSLRRQTFEIVAIRNSPGVFRLFAGEAEGVMPDAEFAVYRSRDLDGNSIGYVRPIPPSGQVAGERQVEVEQTAFTMCQTSPNHVGPPIDLQARIGYAIQVDAGSTFQVQLFLDLSPEHKAVFERAQQEMRAQQAGGRQVEFVEDREAKPDLIVTAQGQTARFEIMDPECRRNGLTSIPFINVTIEHATIFRILCSAANFYFHLRRFSRHSTYRLLSTNVDIKCHNLIHSNVPVPGTLQRVLMPANIDSSLIEDGVLRVPSNQRTLYGYSIRSQFRDAGLYAALFYFDMSDLSISRYYVPNQARRGGSVYSIPPAGAALTIGYGESGTAPRTYTVRQGQDVDVGYLRLFVSTDYADWTHIEQRSPFTDTRTGGSPWRDHRRAVVGWGARTVTVIVTKGGGANDEHSEELHSDVEED